LQKRSKEGSIIGYAVNLTIFPSYAQDRIPIKVLSAYSNNATRDNTFIPMGYKLTFDITIIFLCYSSPSGFEIPKFSSKTYCSISGTDFGVFLLLV
jgi:hypothetical protein